MTIKFYLKWVMPVLNVFLAPIGLSIFSGNLKHMFYLDGEFFIAFILAIPISFFVTRMVRKFIFSGEGSVKDVLIVQAESFLLLLLIYSQLRALGLLLVIFLAILFGLPVMG